MTDRGEATAEACRSDADGTAAHDAARPIRISETFSPASDATIFVGDCRELLGAMPDGAARLIVTSPPYNIGKEYETRLGLEDYISQQREIIAACVRVLSDEGSICWQVGNYVDRGSIVPLDAVLYPIFDQLGLKMRNRIIWHFEHGLHCTRRLSGRHETIMWFTRSERYHFDVDPIRVLQKYPGKRHFKGPRAGAYSGNPLGKNPGDVWVFPNVKHNHVEKTEHPCQFPVELVERLVLSMTRPGDLVVDPFLGVGSSAVAGVRHGRRVAGAEIVAKYAAIARERVELEARGRLRTRPMHRPVYEPTKSSAVAQNPFK